jgi:hypothetical protein
MCVCVSFTMLTEFRTQALKGHTNSKNVYLLATHGWLLLSSPRILGKCSPLLRPHSFQSHMDDRSGMYTNGPDPYILGPEILWPISPREAPQR